MTQFGYLASTLVMGALVVLVFLFTEGKERTTAPPASAGDEGSRFAGLANSPGTWILAFLGLGVVAAGGTAIYVGAFGLSSSGVGLALGVLFALLLSVYALIGTYTSARSFGYNHSQAAAMGIWAVGLLLLLAVSLRLVTAA